MDEKDTTHGWTFDPKSVFKPEPSPGVRIIQGDSREVLKTLKDESVNCVVTSPPYYNLRDYDVDGQIGLESSLEEYIQVLVDIFSEIKRVLTKDGTVWLNLGDGFAANRSYQVPSTKWSSLDFGKSNASKVPQGLKAKDLMMVPHRVALALQADGWWVRADIVWNKPNSLPESVKDRPTRSHEYVFLLTKSAKYYYDADAIKEPCAESSLARISQPTFRDQKGGDKDYGKGTNPNRSGRKTLENFARKQDEVEKRTYTGFSDRYKPVLMRNKRDVWAISTKPFKGAHFAVMPEELVLPCILAGCPEGGVVLDPFAGAGTVLKVALENKRQSIGVELNPEYVDIIRKRLIGTQMKLVA